MSHYLGREKGSRPGRPWLAGPAQHGLRAFGRRAVCRGRSGPAGRRTGQEARPTLPRGARPAFRS